MKNDVLDGFMQETIELNDDYEGKTHAVLVSKKAKSKTKKAVLYIHGFADYFFNDKLAEVFIKAGYDFYSLDLRKYGRSLMDHQQPNHCKDLSEYFEEIDKAVSIIRERDGHSLLVLNGHSTGGLISSLYTHERRNDNLIDGLLLNSPWYDINEDWFTKNIAIKLLYLMGKLFPGSQSPKGLDPNYARSLHKDYNIEDKKERDIYEDGLWDFDTDWKSVGEFPVYNSFLRAVRIGQKKVQKGLDIKCPVFLLRSDKRGARVKNMESHYFVSDCVLNPEHMAKYIGGIGANVKQVVINDGLHDLALSPKSIRDKYFAEVTQWLKGTF
ncbi:MAG: alpha/beta hydrolase [bacterium]|nr:alpha/beta hydrolase [bacterium]